VSLLGLEFFTTLVELVEHLREFENGFYQSLPPQELLLNEFLYHYKAMESQMHPSLKLDLTETKRWSLNPKVQAHLGLRL
jgi:hypothetical protein